MTDRAFTWDRTRHSGPAFALLAAALFGASAPFAKLLLGSVGPWMLASLLYLGAGLGLLGFRVLFRRRWIGAGEVSLSGREWSWLGAAILAGGVAGPVLLMFGLLHCAASTASLLLNLEGVLTALLAWFAFRENFDARVAAGMLAIALGAVLVSWQGHVDRSELLGPLAVAAACLAWAVDNNLTRTVSLADPVQITMLKGLIAGGVNLLLATGRGESLPDMPHLLAVGFLGLVSIGVSLVLYVLALRQVGAARVAAYYSTAPFAGAFIAVGMLGEKVTPMLVIAGALMAAGVWLHLTERHEHEHVHDAIAHTHRHRHDEHHQHTHAPGDPPGEPHTHRHTHAPLRHTHPHYPDPHHRHRH